MQCYLKLLTIGTDEIAEIEIKLFDGDLDVSRLNTETRIVTIVRLD